MTKLFGSAAAAIAALSLTAAPAMAQSKALSLRASTDVKNGSEITSPPLVAIIGLLAIVGGGIFIAVDEDNPDSP